MSKPRRLSLLTTEHFDIIFCEESSATVKFLADNIEKLYDKAKKEIPDANDMHMPVVVSPDSDCLSVEYTCSPYNRIVFFDGVPEADNANFQNAVLGLFYHEIYLALSQSVRSPVNQFIYKTVGGDGYQPVSLFYLPFSFVEGRAFLAEGDDLTSDEKNDFDFESDFGRFNDKYFLQILSVAKYENKFPSWLQAGTVRDVYPGRRINEAAGSAFAAYLIQTYGVEKYSELWNICGNVNFKLTAGLFNQVYGISLDKLWSDFEESVPLPENLEEIRSLEKNVKKIFPSDREGAFQNLLLSDYGLIWYDDIRHEVDIFDWNSKIKMRNLLFLASDINKLSLSEDGRYLIVSFSGAKNRKQFKEDLCRVYDLQKRRFTKIEFKMRDGTSCVLEDGSTVIAGISVKDKHPVINVYSVDFENNKSELIYISNFSENEYPDSLIISRNNKIDYLLYNNGKVSLIRTDIKNNQKRKCDLSYKGTPVKIKNLRLVKNHKAYSFSYVPENEHGFIRMGLVMLDENSEIAGVYFQNNDFAGGVQYPVIYKTDLIYCSDKYTHTEIHQLPFAAASFEIGELIEEEKYDCSNYKLYSDFNFGKNELGDYELNRYNPFKYMINCSVSPFMAIKDLASTEEQKLWPSLGATLITQYDPLMNNRIMISGSGGYAKLDFMTVVNPTVDDINEQKDQGVDDDKNISFGISIENSSTPVDIRAGSVFKFNTDGEYNFTSSLNAIWQIPVRMEFSDVKLSFLSNYTASTDYYDTNLSDHTPSLSGWPKFRDAYETVNLSAGVEFSNINQYGISKYQKRGFSVGAKMDSFWDIYELRLLKKELKNKDGETFLKNLTDAQNDKLLHEQLLEMSQLNVGLFGSVEIPMLNPFTMHNGLVFSMPTTINAELLNKTGTAVHVGIESLLLGYEPQNGIPFLYLFFSRLGVKAGYVLDLNYDTYKVSIPDIRRNNYLWDVFSNTYVRDSFYFMYDMDFSSSIGRLSEYQLNLQMKTEFFPRSKGFAFTFYFRVSY